MNPAGTESTRQTNKRLHLIPNPAGDFVRLVTEGADNNLRFQVLIYNMQGQRVLTIAPYQHGQQIPIGNLTKGTYTIRLLKEQGTEVGYAHFIKQ